MRRRATAKDVAELAGVSRTTVSFVLNDVPGMRISGETRARVRDAARQLRYHPNAAARSMVTGRTSLIGFVLRQRPEQAFADHFLPQVLNGLSQAASEQGYNVLVKPIPPEDDTGAYTLLLRERQVDGIVLSGPRYDDVELLQIHGEGAHVVLLGRLPGADIPSVDVDNVAGARQAVQHLLRLGHTRIAMITNAGPAYTASADRLAGYRQVLEEAGLPYDESLVRFGNFTPDSGFQVMAGLLNLDPRPTAVFIASDTVALGALHTVRRHGLRVPADLAVAGFDDIPLAGFLDPPLTTVRLPAYALGWAAADLLIRLIAGEETGTNTQLTLETELVVRHSCGALGVESEGAAGTPKEALPEIRP